MIIRNIKAEFSEDQYCSDELFNINITVNAKTGWTSRNVAFRGKSEDVVLIERAVKSYKK